MQIDQKTGFGGLKSSSSEGLANSILSPMVLLKPVGFVFGHDVELHDESAKCRMLAWSKVGDSQKRSDDASIGTRGCSGEVDLACLLCTNEPKEDAKALVGRAGRGPFGSKLSSSC